MHSRRHRRTRLVSAAIALLLASPLSGCGYLSPTDGDVLARRGAESIAAEIGSHTDNTARTTIEEMVVYWLPDNPITAVRAELATVDALAWSGQIGPQSDARIDVRIHVKVEAYSDPTIGGRSNSAGEITICYRLEWPPYEEATRSEISCPDTAAPPLPELPVRPELTVEDTARVAQILTDVSALPAIEAALHDAFPDEHFHIESALWNGETVVAVGIPEERECILIVRDGAGTLSYPSYRRISLEPGETGCSTSLYMNPPF